MNKNSKQVKNTNTSLPESNPVISNDVNTNDNPSKKCINCGQSLIHRNDVWLCPKCNLQSVEFENIFKDPEEDKDYIFIECPGASLYEPGTDNIIAGVKFKDNNDLSGEYEIIRQPIYAPTHTRRRRIKKEALGKIRRCQGCQDYTVRMRRKEGPDFFIPSVKYPNRKKLKSVVHQNTP